MTLAQPTFPARTRIVRTPTLVIDCEESGPEDGEPVVLLHGFPYDPRCFDRIAPRLAAGGCRVNCVRLGHIYTEMYASGGGPERVDRVKDRIPMGRGGEPDEVARTILWLAGAEASFVTGTFLDVTGGK